MDNNVGGEEPASEPLQESVPAEIGADRSNKTPKRGGARFGLMGCAVLGLTAVVAFVAGWFVIQYALGPEFLPDLLVIIHGEDAPKKKFETPPPDPNKDKPEPQGLADRLVGTWSGDLPTGEDFAYIYGKDGQFTVIAGRPGKQPPRAMSGTWKATRTEGETLHIHRESAMPQGGDAFGADATITFPAPNEMEHSLKKGTVRCRRQAP